MGAPKSRNRKPNKPRRNRRTMKQKQEAAAKFKKQLKRLKKRGAHRWPKTVEAIRPLSDFILVEPVERADTSEKGVAYSHSAVAWSGESVVVSVGPGYMLKGGRRRPMTVRPGDRVTHLEGGGMRFKVDGVKFTMIREAEVMAMHERWSGAAAEAQGQFAARHGSAAYAPLMGEALKEFMQKPVQQSLREAEAEDNPEPEPETVNDESPARNS